MSETAQTRGKLWSTPFRDLLRGRITGRLDWKSQLKQLPAPAAQLIQRVVKRTRLWRLEKAAVANELLAHFLDGLESGATADDLVKNFGDERVAAKLIRRAKRRNRPLPWQVWNVVFKITCVFLAIYAVLVIRFCIGRPAPSVDYLARLNAPILATPMQDRAWPIWRQAIIATDHTNGFAMAAANAAESDPNEMPWSAAVQWLDQHNNALVLARQAAQKPILGFVLGPGGSQEDPELQLAPASNDKSQLPLLTVLLPHLNHLRWMGNILALDVRHAAELHDGARVEADLNALLGLARQLREADGFLITHLVALGIDEMAVDRLNRVVSEHPDVLSDAQLVRFAHALAGPRVAGDLITLQCERYFFQDVVQRIYTDDGHGDGHLTLKAAQLIPMLTHISPAQDTSASQSIAVASIAPVFAASRAELLSKYNQMMDEVDADFQKPVRLVDRTAIENQIRSIKNSPAETARYTLISVLMPSLIRFQESAERYLGNRDGALVGIALEIYHRRHRAYPATLAELTPELLPAIPTDRITGDPVKYHVIDGKPVVYSVGADRVDNGGKRPTTVPFYSHQTWPDRWDPPDSRTPACDWILYPPDLQDSK